MSLDPTFKIPQNSDLTVSGPRLTPILPYTAFTNCSSLSELSREYESRGHTFDCEQNLLAQIQADWSKVHVSTSRYFVSQDEGRLEPTVSHKNGKSRSIFGLRHCIDPTLPEFSFDIEEYLQHLSPGPLYVEHNIGPNLELTLPYEECADWIVMSTAERFCYGVAFALSTRTAQQKLHEDDTLPPRIVSSVWAMSGVALEHIVEPSALRKIQYLEEEKSLFEKLSEHQGVFSPLLYGSSRFGIVPEYVDLELKLAHGIPLSVNERRSLFISIFLDALPHAHTNAITGSAHSAQISYFQKYEHSLGDYQIIKNLAIACAELAVTDPKRYKTLCDAERKRTLNTLDAGQVIMKNIIQGAFTEEVDGKILHDVQTDIATSSEERELEKRYELYFS